MTLERQLVNALKSNERNKIEATFKRIYDSYFKLVYFCISSYVNVKEDIEDLASEVFLSFFNHLNIINLNGSIKYYLVKSAKNVSINYLKRKKEVSLFKEEIIEYEEKYSDILEVIKKYLSSDEREIIIDHVILGKSLRLIAKERLQNVNTIKSKYRRSIKKLRSILGDKR